ncbi:hypothetical protein L1887_12797 [Cichorium endivia]|nr:hypothetical protein L1887_12797 [Cichorium endivia]
MAELRELMLRGLVKMELWWRIWLAKSNKGNDSRKIDPMIHAICFQAVNFGNDTLKDQLRFNFVRLSSLRLCVVGRFDGQPMLDDVKQSRYLLFIVLLDPKDALVAIDPERWES